MPDIFTLPTTTPGQDDALDAVLKEFEGSLNFDNTIRFRPPRNLDRYAPGLTSLQQISLAGLERMGSEFFAGQGPTAEAFDVSLGTLTEIAGRGPAELAPFYRAGVVDPMLEILHEDVLPGISGRFAGSDFFGTERANAEARALDDFFEGTTEGFNRFVLANEQLRLQAAGAIPGAAAARLGVGEGFFRIGEAERDVYRDQYLAAERDHERRLQERMFAANAMINAARTDTFENVLYQKAPKGESPWVSIATGLATGLGAGLLAMI